MTPPPSDAPSQQHDSVENRGADLVCLVPAGMQVVKQLGARGEGHAAAPAAPPVVKGLHRRHLLLRGHVRHHQRALVAAVGQGGHRSRDQAAVSTCINHWCVPG